MDLSSWPAGMRVIVCKKRPHPGAQLQSGDVDCRRITAFVTTTGCGQLADLELRHRRRARHHRPDDPELEPRPVESAPTPHDSGTPCHTRRPQSPSNATTDPRPSPAP